MPQTSTKPNRLKPPQTTILTRDPKTTHRLNCNAFQQHALISAFNFQYAVFYISDTPSIFGSPRHVCIARRHLLDDHSLVDEDTDPWQRVILRDYAQTHEDGHNTISMGISPGDGRIHLVWDLHNDTIRYRWSVAGLAWSPDPHLWTAESFGEIDYTLPGTGDAFKGKEVTYPRFVNIANGEMLFECRLGRAGAGSAALCRYCKTVKGEWQWKWQGVYLKGTDCSPYVNGIHYHAETEKLYVTWTNRRFIELQREADTSEVSQQAGPNGPENNEDLGCLVSGDVGASWQDSNGNTITRQGADGELGVIGSRDDGVIVRRIPRNSGIMNQEGQCADADGGIHVLMRDNVDTDGSVSWKHHWRAAGASEWHTDQIPDMMATSTGSRGKVCCDPRTGDLWFVIPGNLNESLTLLRRKITADGRFLQPARGRLNEHQPFELMWQATGFDGEPLLDEERFCNGGGRLNIMTRDVVKDDTYDVVVLDFDLTDL